LKRLASLWAIVVLALPPPSAQGKTIRVGLCGGAKTRIAIPVNQSFPGRNDAHDCCKKGCHAANDRRKRLGLATGGDDCCR
jgi:hypothetical protein